MLKPELSSRFKRDYGLLEKRGYKMSKLDAVIDLLLRRAVLDRVYRDHLLKGKWSGYRECHISDDWILVYRVDGKNLKLALTRTGTHQDVFED